MIFSSFEYFILFTIFTFFYYLTSSRITKNYLILFGSFFFIAFTHYKHLLILLIFLFIFLLTIHLFNKKKLSNFNRSIILISLIFLIFKYYSIIKFENFSLLNKTFYMFLPIGISFYTFQIIGALVDVKFQADKKFYKNKLLDLSVFVCFFPQLIAGPICRVKNILFQLSQRRSFNNHNFSIGTFLIFLGLLKKVLISDQLYIYTYEIWQNPQNFNSETIWIALFAYYIQIYADFSGYTDIGRGCARILGLKIPINFTNPYFACSPGEFFNRWHISLSSWIRDYIFNPLNIYFLRKFPKFVNHFIIINLFIVMFLFGVWHGNTFKIIFYGIILGIMVSFWHIMRLNNFENKYKNIFGFIWTQGFFIFSLIFLNTKNLDNTFLFLKSLISSKNNNYVDILNITLFYYFLIVFLQVICMRSLIFKNRNYLKILFNKYSPYIYITLIIFIYVLKGYFFGPYGIPFDHEEIAFTYFQF